jgi:glycosyltransferase involved in cell wall biosynthesis
LVSVVLPIYNQEKYINRCLDSIYAQEYQNLEIICVNDGSTDGTLNLLQAEKDMRLLIINQENQGVSFARNNGMSQAKGKYLAFVDPDDYLLPGYFSSHVSILESDDSIDFVGFADQTKNSFKNLDLVGREAIAVNLDTVLKIGIWCKIYRHSVLVDNQLQFLPHRLGEDLLFTYELLKYCNHIVMRSGYYYFYDTDHVSATTGIFNDDSIDRDDDIFKEKLVELYRFFGLTYNFIDRKISRLYGYASQIYTNSYSNNFLVEFHQTKIDTVISQFNWRQLSSRKAKVQYLLLKYPRILSLVLQARKLQRVWKNKRVIRK